MPSKVPLKHKPESQTPASSGKNVRTSTNDNISTYVVQRALRNPNSVTLTPGVLGEIQRQFGNQFAHQLVQRAELRSLPTPPPESSADEGTSDGLVIQRLPSRTDAEREGGKAGFKKGGSTWSKLLDALGDFKVAEILEDRQKMLTSVIDLQKYSKEWLESDSRTSIFGGTKKKDNRKREFLHKLTPQLRMLYLDLSNTKATTIDRAKTNALQHSGENIQSIKEQLLLAEIDNSNETITAMTEKLRQADLTYNFDPNVLNFLLASPDFKTIWQLTYKQFSPGGLITSDYDKMKGYEKREMAERYLGYPPFTESQRDNRPAYVGINVLNKPKGAAPTYGDFYFVFKHAIKERATYTAYDTFKMISGDQGLKDIPEKAIGSTDNMEAILAHNNNLLLVLASIVNDIELNKKQLQLAMGLYVEAQIHGGLTVSDIDALVVNYPQDENKQDDFEKERAKLVKSFKLKYPHVKIRHQ